MNIGLITPDAQDICSLYRAWGPFTALRRDAGGQINLLSFSGWGWSEVCQCDVIFCQRPFHRMHANILRMAHDLGVKTWVEFDDDLLNVPYWHPAAKHHGEQFRQILADVLSFVDVVTVSTDAIRASLCAFAAAARVPMQPEKVCVIPNAWDARWLMNRPVPTGEQNPVVSWRGGRSGSHMQDLGKYLPNMGRVAKRFPGLTWAFLGCIHWDVATAIGEGRVRTYQEQDFFSYLHSFRSIRPAVHLVPLVDTPFNRGKSNCAWLEATIAGAVVVAPDWPEWTRPGVMNYTSEYDFETVVEAALAGGDLVEQRRQESMECIRRQLTIETVNEMRARILKELLA